MTWINLCCEKMDVTRVEDLHDLRKYMLSTGMDRKMIIKDIKTREKKRSSFSMDM